MTTQLKRYKDADTRGYIAQSTVLDFAHELIDDCGILEGLPEEMHCYFDVESYARDLEASGGITEFTYGGSTYIAHGY